MDPAIADFAANAGMKELGKVGVPTDPFGNGPLRYDPKSRRLWSVGVDGRDDGGKGKPNASKPDMVVRVP